MPHTFLVEVTDTYGGEANYCWVKHYAVTANTQRGAICKVAKETGYRFRSDGLRYNVKGAAVCAFVFEPGEYAAEMLDKATKL
jgi:hypothetical protein